MSWDRDEAAAQYEAFSQLTERLNDIAHMFEGMHNFFQGQQSGLPGVGPAVSPTGDSEDFAFMKDFSIAVADSTTKLIDFGKSLDELGEKISNTVREQASITSAGGYGPAAASYGGSGGGGGSGGSGGRGTPSPWYSPIKNYNQASDWLYNDMIAKYGTVGGTQKFIERTTPDGNDLLGFLQAGMPMGMATAFATKNMKNSILAQAQAATKSPNYPLAKIIKKHKVPKSWWASRGHTMASRMAKGAYWGGIAGGAQGAGRGILAGAGLELFKNPALLAGLAVAAMPFIMASTAAATERQMNSNRAYAGFAPETVNAFIDYDYNQTWRNINRAQSTSRSAVNLIQQQDRLRDAMVPWDNLTQNAGNVGASFFAGVSTRFFQNFSGLFTSLNDMVSSDRAQDVANRAGAIGGDWATGATIGAAIGLLTIPWLGWFGPALGAAVGGLVGTIAGGFGAGAGTGMPAGGAMFTGPIWSGPVSPRPLPI